MNPRGGLLARQVVQTLYGNRDRGGSQNIPNCRAQYTRQDKCAMLMCINNSGRIVGVVAMHAFTLEPMRCTAHAGGFYI